MKNKPTKRIQPVSKKQAPSQKNEIKELVKRNEFWIGVATVFSILLLSGVFFYRQFAVASKAATLSQAPTKTPEVKRTLTELLPPGVKKLADTSGFLNFITQNKLTPTPTAAPKQAVLSNNTQSNQPASEERSTNQNNSQTTNQPASEERSTNQNNSQTTNQPATAVVNNSATPAPTYQPAEEIVPTLVITAIPEEIIPTVPPVDIEPTKAPEEEPQEVQNEQEQEQNNNEKEGNGQANNDGNNEDQEKHEESNE